MGNRITGIGAAVAVGAVLVLVGCAAPGGAELNPAELAVRGQAADIAREIAGIADQSGLEDPSDALQEYARRAVPELVGTGAGPMSSGDPRMPSPVEAGGLRLVAIEPAEDAGWNDPVGSLVLATDIRVLSSEAGEERTRCFRLELDRWGPAAGWDETAAIAADTECPDELVSVEPEPDVRAIIVVPENAEAVATAVLAGAGEETAAELEQAVAAQLAVPTGEREIAAAVHVEREGERIGLAMGDADDCLLLRAESGTVDRLHLAPEQLQPGELGCASSTALLDDDALAPPH
ncbi:hypothetical protein [Agromyces seonyuensis]|uniref:Uncharacterized protein n=1 Tax=Agromyces seonyuensis TaxID=2662446 RepID=A0A6I4NY01_9MICO|nr:hypothetical protein [Agromyces seonyuensis]MWB99163.1 hypothetical protein [Agromyces seonyuensis]